MPCLAKRSSIAVREAFQSLAAATKLVARNGTESTPNTGSSLE